MSFEPLQFKFNPPPTVPEPSRVDLEGLLAAGAGSAQTPSAASNAAQLIDQISGLRDTSKYLQDAIVQRFASTGIEIDLKAKPEAALALTRIYGTDDPPGIITIPMFANMLDGEAAIAQMEIALGPDSDLQPNPIQAADLNLVTTTVEGLLIDTGQFQYQLPGLLRELKADQIAFQNWTDSLQDYPVMRGSATSAVIPPNLSQNLLAVAGLDVSDPVANMLRDWGNRYSANYASVYQFTAGISSVDRTISSVVNVYIQQPLQDIVRIVALLNGLKGLFHKKTLKDAADILTTFVFARMASELGALTMMMDRYVHMAVDPFKSVLGSLSHLMGTINRSVSIVGSVVHGGIAGLSQANACSQRPHAVNTSGAKALKVPILDDIPKALQVLGQHLNWATHLADAKSAKIQESMAKLLERKNKKLADKLDTLCSLQSLDTLIGIAQGVVRETQKGGSFSGANVSPAQQIQSLTNMLSSVRTGAGTPFVIQDGQVIATPASMPTPSAAVEKIFKMGGLDRVAPADLSKITGVL